MIGGQLGKQRAGHHEQFFTGQGDGFAFPNGSYGGHQAGIADGGYQNNLGVPRSGHLA